MQVNVTAGAAIKMSFPVNKKPLRAIFFFAYRYLTIGDNANV